MGHNIRYLLFAALVVIMCGLAGFSYFAPETSMSKIQGENLYLETPAAPEAGDFELRKININSAHKEELMSLTGIGEVKAQAIIDYREQVAPFKVVDDLLEVKGIGPSTLEKIKELVCVE